MVASRKKKLENRMGAQRTATGGRFKVSYWAGYHETMRPQIVLDKPEPEVTFKLPVAGDLRYGGPVLQLCAAGYVYPGAAAAARPGDTPPRLGGAPCHASYKREYLCAITALSLRCDRLHSPLTTLSVHEARLSRAP